MNIKELKETTTELSLNIEELITEFETNTGCTISGIELSRINVSTIDRSANILNVDLKVEL